MNRQFDFKPKLLLFSFVVTAGLSVLARLFAPPGLVGWPETIGAALVSLVLFHLITVLFASKSKSVIVRYILLVLLLLAAGLYFSFTRTLLCNDTVVGTTLDSSFTNAQTVKMNQDHTKCEIPRYVAADPDEVWMDIAASKRKLQLSFLGFVVFLVAFFTHITEEFFVRTGFSQTDLQSLTPTDANSVFISYNHEDQPTAILLKNELAKNKIATIIDMESMAFGTEIDTFIRESVQQSLITLSIVSERSMLSGWVATETLNTFFLQKFDSRKKFIACYLDDAFLSDDFAERAFKTIDEKLDKLNERIEDSNRKKLNRRDLDAQKNSLYTLRQNLDEIIRRLRDAKCVDMRPEKLQANLPQLIREVKSIVSG